MFNTIAPSRIGNGAAITPARNRSPSDRQEHGRGDSQGKSSDDIDTLEITPSTATNHYVDKSA